MVGKANSWINVEKIIIGLNNSKLKFKKVKKKKKKKNSTELQKPNAEAEVYNSNKKMWLRKKKLKSLIRFHSANKINNYNRGGKKGKKKKSKRIYRASQNIRIIDVFLESLLSESSPSLGVTVHLTSLGSPPTLCWSLDLLWGQLRL